MKKVGIWIDKKEARIISIEGGNEHFNTISSMVEDFHPGGGSGTKLKGGPQDVVQDRKYLERQKHQLATFFKDVAKGIEGADAVVIFGPAQTGQKLHDKLMEKHSPFHDKTIAVKKADNMTDNQIVAWVKEHYDISL